MAETPSVVFGTPASPVKKGPQKRSPYFQEPRDPMLEARLGLRQALRELRKHFAATKKVPVYFIFNNKTLDDLVIRLPMTDMELKAIHGIGPQKAKEYGPSILEAIRKDRQEIFAF
ncbi:ATP-dependent DNA helicase RecQ [Seminavis robusta]|uniref:ATP-dependent DNA helicase RecQ n=1 Tax=Seminavis robusta TaxID=568900 RepID=A0A9N8H774_9STRA|nr:ATP-dependent DNA helicase RecQ [Seminavis robusta]|eukprot:Sro195_g083080.1 ATP-dependent DNA helicase RecQ (116) ;mRNA; r:1503-1850